MTTPPGLRIPPERLSPETLRGVIEEFVTRDGTNLAEADHKIEQVQRLLREGRAELWFDSDSGTCNILAPPDAGRPAAGASESTPSVATDSRGAPCSD